MNTTINTYDESWVKELVEEVRIITLRARWKGYRLAEFKEPEVVFDKMTGGVKACTHCAKFINGRCSRHI